MQQQRNSGGKHGEQYCGIKKIHYFKLNKNIQDNDGKPCNLICLLFSYIQKKAEVGASAFLPI
jgi:hypothetical protein